MLSKPDGGTPTRFERRPVTANDSWRKFYKNKPLLNALGKFANRL
jgi:hypothetical protein